LSFALALEVKVLLAELGNISLQSSSTKHKPSHSVIKELDIKMLTKLPLRKRNCMREFRQVRERKRERESAWHT